jgi:hypothetical protein
MQLIDVHKATGDVEVGEETFQATGGLLRLEKEKGKGEEKKSERRNVKTSKK